MTRIRPVTYRYNGRGGSGYDDKKQHIGIIAQEVAAVAPYMVKTFEGTLDGKPAQLLNYDGHALPFLLVNAVKELKAANDNVAAENAKLRASMEDLRREVELWKFQSKR